MHYFIDFIQLKYYTVTIMKTNFTILQNFIQKAPVKQLVAFANNPCDETYFSLSSAVFNSGWQNNFIENLKDALIKDVNAFSVSASKGKSDKYLENAFDLDSQTLFSIAGTLPSDLFCVGKGKVPTSKTLKRFYATHGYGVFIENKAFYYKDGEILPVKNVSPIQISDLKDYVSEKKAISDNIENFLSSLPHANMLLYGDRGTGKSSTIHAFLNKYAPCGLRLVELQKENITELSALKKSLEDIPLKFIIYIDDLSLNDTDGKFTALKAALEGSFSGLSNNTLVCATSNRRHIVKESFSDRNDSVHAGDSMQEQLSLSDRFGLTVLFSSTSKPEYISIFKQLALDYGLETDIDSLIALAERWAINKGGRSPRRAKQFVEFAYSCEKRNVPIEF